MRKQKIKKWLLYTLVLLTACLLQTTVFNRFHIWGIIPQFVPLAVVCAAVLEGGDDGAAFGLGAGLLLAFTGADNAVFYVVTLTLAGAAAGGLCKNYLTVTVVTGALLGLLTVLFCEGVIWLFGVAVGTLPPWAFLKIVLPETLVTFLFTPLFFYPARFIHKNIDTR